MVWSKNESRMGHRRMKLDREKVIKSAEICLKHIDESDCPQECPYFEQCSKYERRVIFQPLIRDALALLKEQEARILDWDELEDWENAVWFEDKDEHECYIALIANVGAYHAKFTNVEPGNIHSLAFMRYFYMKEWRCWSARPTIKQRQAVKWNDRGT